MKSLEFRVIVFIFTKINLFKWGQLRKKAFKFNSALLIGTNPINNCFEFTCSQKYKSQNEKKPHLEYDTDIQKIQS